MQKKKAGSKPLVLEKKRNRRVPPEGVKQRVIPQRGDKTNTRRNGQRKERLSNGSFEVIRGEPVCTQEGRHL